MRNIFKIFFNILMQLLPYLSILGPIKVRIISYYHQHHNWSITVRFTIQYLTTTYVVLTQQQCIDELNSIFDNEASSRTSVYRWYDEFYQGRGSLQYEFRDKISCCSGNQLILQDCHVTYREIDTTLGISGTSIHSMLHEDFTVKKICSHWIPHNLSIAQKKPCIDWSNEILQKYNRIASKHI